jgi:putative oxidoreductase
MKLLRLDFLANTDLGLLILRAWLGLSMLILHGMPKLQKFAALSEKFPDPFGIGHKPSLILALVAELAGSVLIVAGFLTRFASASLVVTMAVAFFAVHGGALQDNAATGAKSGELAYIYMAGFVALLFTGAGRYSVDRS